MIAIQSFDAIVADTDAISDVCSVQTMTIEVFNIDPVPANSVRVTDYAGTVNLSTTGGGWVDPGGNSGTLSDTFPQDGAATYQFVSGDAGVVTLDFRTNVSGSYNFSVTQGAISADNTQWDPDLVVSLCTFRISMVDASMNACSSENITIQVFDNLGGTVSGYTGTVSISTSTLNGNWSTSGPGVLVDPPGEDNGVAAYTFSGTETNSTVTFTFIDPHAETVNVNLIAGQIVEDGAYDPSLTVTGCVPSIVSSVCYDGPNDGGAGSLTLSATPGSGRMVVMWVFWAGDAGAKSVTSAALGGTAMTQVGQISPANPVNGMIAINTGVAMYAIDNDDIDAGGHLDGATLAGTYGFNVAPANTPAMCLAELENVKQNAYPQFASPRSTGQVNTNNFGNTGSFTTSISTSANNALVLSGVSSNFNAGGGNSWLNDVNPDPPMSMLFTGNNNQNPSAGAAGGSQGLKAVAGLITVEDIDNQAATTSAVQIVASFNPLVTGPPQAEGFVPVLLHETLSGNSSYRAIGRTLRARSNSSTVPNNNGECDFVNESVGSNATLTMPGGSTVQRAYLYWAASGVTPDLNIEFGETGGTMHSLTGAETFQATNAGLDFYASYRDVTTEVGNVGNASYTFRELDTSAGSGAPWGPGSAACAGGWALVVVYTNPDEEFRVTNIFHGFQPFQNSSFTLVPRNFRMQTTDDDVNGFLPNGLITHVTVEGDETLQGGAGGGESLAMQDGPGDTTFTVLTNPYNPATGDFNSTVTRPVFELHGGTGKYQWIGPDVGPGGGPNDARDGYETDAAAQYDPFGGSYNPDNGDTRQLGDSWGFDVDTHYLAGNTVGTELYPFAQDGAEAESITTEYSSGQDLVLLLSELIAVTNFDLADLEVFKAVSGVLKVNQAQDYTFTVTNNGNNGVSGGEATGLVVLADVLPNGMTLNSVTGTNWSCVDNGPNGTAFSCTFDLTVLPGGQLSNGLSLPTLTANVQVGDFSFFPDEVNPAKNIIRMQHNGANNIPSEAIDTACLALITNNPGVIPNPNSCRRSPQFDNVNDLDGGATNINDLEDKDIAKNNNVHSIVTNVIGLRTDLAIDKTINGNLEVGDVQTYTITVTNNGPDATNETITVLDNAPAGINFTGAAGAGWICTTNTAAQINCGYAAALPALSSAVLTLPVNVVGAAGLSVTNTAQVTPGIHNFDTINTANNTDSATSVIIAPPVASQEEFLISVSVPGNATTIGGLGPFENDDYINYNPQTDIGTSFYDDSASGDVDDANAVHVFKNGHIAISASGKINPGGTSTVGGLAFQPEDIVVYDPIENSAVMLFDGSAIFDRAITANHNIDAVYVKESGEIVFSTFGPACITNDIGPAVQVCFQRGDVVQYDPTNGSATILIDAFNAADMDDEVFASEVQVNGIYLRVDDSGMDPSYNEVKEVYILTVNTAGTVQVGACAACDPAAGTSVSRDDIVEVDLTGANPATQNLFLGNVANGVFSPVSNAREIDAIHVKEDGYHGHFAISQSQAGSTCEAGQITIRKHEFDHDVDTDYTGSILITTDDGGGMGIGVWSLADGDGTLTTVPANEDGVAKYRFVPSDMGEVTLYLTQTDVATIDVNVTNQFVSEQEDPSFVFANVVTNISYRDEFTAAAFDNQDGLTPWKEDWLETDSGGVGPGAGDVTISAGSMQFTAVSGAAEMMREVDLSFGVNNDLVQLSFDFKYSNLNAVADSFVAEVRESDSDAWAEVWAWDAGGSNANFQSSGQIDLAAAIAGFSGWSDSAQIRFRVDTGYATTGRMFIDNVLLETGTAACGVGVMDHYEIRIDAQTGTSAGTVVSGISCLATQITVSGHNGLHEAAEPGESITLRALSQTLVEKGTWNAPFLGSGIFTDAGTATDGIATYTFPPGETQVGLNFNYTNPTLSPEDINFNITSAFGVHPNEDPTLRIRDIALRIYNDTVGAVNSIPTQIAGKSSTVPAPTADVLVLQVLTVDTADTTQCIPLIDDGETHSFTFVLECIDSASCNAGALNGDAATINGAEIGLDDRDDINPPGGFMDVDLTFENTFTTAGIAAPIDFMYQNAGNVQLHAQFEVPTNIRADTAPGNIPGQIGAAVDAPLATASNVFTVRPFGLDIDFSGGRADLTPGQGGNNDESFAADADGTGFAVAGVGFSTTVRGVQYDPADDVAGGADGIPDTDSELWDNLLTPNFGNDSSANTYKVRVASTTVAPPGGYGTLTDNDFTTIVNGEQSHSMTFDEVGIIDLEASLLLTADDNAATYLLSGVQLTGHARNVGRFYPASFELSGGSILSRVEASMQSMCINSASDFTYMGEDFQFSAMLEAQNAVGVRTKNYVSAAASAGNFAKLDNGDLQANNFSIFEQLSGIDNDLSSRRAIGSTAPDVAWPTEAADQADRGIALLSGNLVFNRQADGSEDGPYEPVNPDDPVRVALSIGLDTADSDGAQLELDVDLDEVMPIANDVALLATESFRYGRLMIDNAFGPETEELAIPFRIEYWNGYTGTWAVNDLDSCTVLTYNASQDIASQRSLFYVDGSYEGAIDDDANNSDDGETVIESAAVVADTDVTVSIRRGQTASAVDADVDGINEDRPFFSSAPGEGLEGSVLIEFDLNHASLPYSLDFLSYDWRSNPELDVLEEVEDGNYDNNPRGQLNFGSYRGHDRVINWQEIYIGPGP